MSWNIACLPEFINIFGNGLIDNIKRTNKIIKIIKETDIDIICLQEVFDLEVRDLILKHLRYKYHVFMVKDDHLLGFNNDGLLILSKYKATKMYMYNLGIKYGEEVLINKKVFGIKVIIDDKDIQIFNIHLQATPVLFKNTTLSNITKFKQLNNALKFINQYKQINTKQILIGDFNININDDFINDEVLTEIVDDDIMYKYIIPYFNNLLIKPNYSIFSKNDYIIPFFENDMIFHPLLEGYNLDELSDHYPVISTISVD